MLGIPHLEIIPFTTSLNRLILYPGTVHHWHLPHWCCVVASVPRASDSGSKDRFDHLGKRMAGPKSCWVLLFKDLKNITVYTIYNKSNWSIHVSLSSHNFECVTSSMKISFFSGQVTPIAPPFQHAPRVTQKHETHGCSSALDGQPMEIPSMSALQSWVLSGMLSGCRGFSKESSFVWGHHTKLNSIVNNNAQFGNKSRYTHICIYIFQTFANVTYL